MELAEATVHETARELGCEPENELILEAAHGLKADAERYRWLRDRMTGDNAHRVHDETCSNLLTGPELDAAIDAARLTPND